MTEQNNLDFLADPLAFCDTHSLRADADNVMFVKNKPSYKSVPSNRRVWFWNIKDAAEAGEGHHGLNFIDILPDPTEGYRPCFWLPWEMGQIIKCTLNDKGHRGGDEEVDVFFTAPVDGCSVLIEGPPHTPSVYHANAGDYAVGNGPYEQRRNRTDEIEHRWRGVPLPKRARPQHLNNGMQYQAVFTGRALHGHDYMADYLAPTDEPEKVRKSATNIKEESVIQNKYTGTVFGLRDPDTGNWDFYYQKLLYIYYSTPEGRGIKRWFHSKAIHFWPGHGSLVLHKRSGVHRVDPEFGIEMK